MSTTSYFYLDWVGEKGPCPTCGQDRDPDFMLRLLSFLKEKYGDNYIDPFDTETTWYEYREDMAEFSKMYPEILFELTVVGDSWDGSNRLYAQAGKTFLVEGYTVYPSYDPDKMEEYEYIEGI